MIRPQQLAGSALVAASCVAAQACKAVQCIPIDEGQSAIVAQVAVDHTQRIEGVVIDMASRPVLSARVRLHSADTTWHDVDASGRFTFAAPARSTITLDVIAAHHDSVSQVLPAPTSSGVRVVAVLAPIPSVVTGKPVCAAR